MFSILAIIVALANLSLARKFTPLEIDNHPCAPENLRVKTRVNPSKIAQ
jgi:hypothetical protein